LKENQSALAEEYIRNTPKQINTKYNKLIIETLGWNQQIDSVPILNDKI